MSNGFNAASYQAWRAKYPWTDEECARACESTLPGARNDYERERMLRAADQCRKGRISGNLIAYLLPLLITHCACGRRALYRNGLHGFCSEHRHLATYERQKLTKALDVLRTEKECQITAREQELDNGNRHHNACGKKPYPRK